MARYLDLHPVDPQPRLVGQVVAALRDDVAGGLDIVAESPPAPLLHTLFTLRVGR